MRCSTFRKLTAELIHVLTLFKPSKDDESDGCMKCGWLYSDAHDLLQKFSFFLICRHFSPHESSFRYVCYIVCRTLQMDVKTIGPITIITQILLFWHVVCIVFILVHIFVFSLSLSLHLLFVCFSFWFVILFMQSNLHMNTANHILPNALESAFNSFICFVLFCFSIPIRNWV